MRPDTRALIAPTGAALLSMKPPLPPAHDEVACAAGPQDMREGCASFEAPCRSPGAPQDEALGSFQPVSRDEALRPVPFRGGGFETRPLWVAGPVVFVVLIGIWEIGSRTGFIGSLILPAPSAVWGALVELYTSGQLALHLRASLSRLLIGWVCGVTLGVVVGLLIGLLSLARAGLLPLVAAIFPIPKIALLPLFVIWFGIGEGSKVATILFGTFFPVVLATYSGVDTVDRTLIRMGQSFGLPWLSIVRKIIVPGAMPAIMSGIRISASIGIILLVAAEMIGAEYGIGAYILTAGAIFSTEQLVAGVAILSVIGLLASAAIGAAERRVLAWRSR